MELKRSQVVALTALTAAVAAAGVTIFLRNRRKHEKRREFFANAGYEMAYDIHYPVKYRGTTKSSQF